MLRIKKPTLIGYVRSGDADCPKEKQLAEINNYCLEHGYKLTQVYEENANRPGASLSSALFELGSADGLIVHDLNRLVRHKDDRLLELRPMIDTHFVHKGKILISLVDGVDTSTGSGQETLMDILNEWSNRDDYPVATKYYFENDALTST